MKPVLKGEIKVGDKVCFDLSSYFYKKGEFTISDIHWIRVNEVATAQFITLKETQEEFHITHFNFINCLSKFEVFYEEHV